MFDGRWAMGDGPELLTDVEKETFVLRSPQLRNRRAIDVYLPASYAVDGRRRFPVVYMHDGQNLFDAATSFVMEPP